MLRAILLAIVVSGLVPELHEAVELVTHYVATGHIAHASDHERDLSGNEHTCTPLAHHCGCCPSLYAGPVQAGGWTPPARAARPVLPQAETALREGVRAELFRPPV